MKRNKEIAARAFFGFCVGVTIAVFVCILVSACIGQSRYLAVMPQFAKHFEKEWVAVAVFMLWAGLLGVDFAEASLVFELERWSEFMQYLVHFLLTSALYLPFLWICYLPFRLSSVFAMLLNIALTYGITWSVQHRQNKKNIAQINAALERRRNRDGH